jgi:VanZ family protein
MSKLLRKKLARIALLFYWPALFILAHSPLPKVVHEAHITDRSLHFLTYFILVVLIWTAAKPYEKVKWHKPFVWIILAVMVGYGAVDEWLQHWVEGRTADLWDYVCDLAGVSAGLLLLSILSFRPALLFTTGLAIFLTTGFSKTELIEHWPVARFSFYFLAYAGFTCLWLFFLFRTQHPPGPATSSYPQFNGRHRLILGATLPVLLLVCVKIGTSVLGRRFVAQDIATAAMGIAFAIGAFYSVRRMIINRCSQSIKQEKT